MDWRLWHLREKQGSQMRRQLRRASAGACWIFAFGSRHRAERLAGKKRCDEHAALEKLSLELKRKRRQTAAKAEED